jgi:glutaredoxin
MQATVYSKDNCPFCVRAKRLLEQKGIAYMEVSAVDHREQLIETVTKATGSPPKTVPQIWLNDQYIGGYTELDAYFKKSDANQ